jgi:glycosyltransferase involved in cell wall biosynthesis
MSDVLVVANEAIQPAVTGGRIRMAALVDALRSRFDVRVHEPAASSAAIAATFRGTPRLGTAMLDRATLDVSDARVVLYTHSYLEPVGPRVDVPVVVDFQNLEVDRQASLATTGSLPRRAIAAIEAGKARRWEPATARRASVCVAVTEHDADVLRRWGAHAVVVVPNAATATRCPPSPADGPVTFFANTTYGPNREAADRLRRSVWPLVVAHRPTARLRICGRGTDDEVDDVEPVFRGASLLLAPVGAGGGTQLKVIEALAHGRVVVATEYSARSAPASARDACVATVDAADMAATIVRLLDDVDERHRREAAAHVPTWSEACAPLVDAIAHLL